MRGLITILFILLFILGCESNGPIAPGGNNTAPGWVGQGGIISVVAGESVVTVYYGEAIDFQDPPVEYLVFMDQDENPWDQNPIVTEKKSPYVVTGLTNGTTYWFGVRAEDSAKPPHVDENVKVLTAMPRSGDRTPPEWDDTVGVVSVVPGDSEATVYYGSATDAESPPVKYLVYMDTDDDPWDQVPIERDTSSLYPLNDLTNYTTYWLGVRCRDSAGPQNIDGNTVVISTVPEEPGWAQTWGGNDDDFAYSVVVDAYNNVYVTGFFTDTADFDPGSGIDDHSSNGYGDAFLSKFDSSGNFKWTRTWGGETDDDYSYAVAVDESGNAYVMGYFSGTVDFDPGSGVDFHTAEGYSDNFISKFDSPGNFRWTCTWGMKDLDRACDIAADKQGNVYMTGGFSGTLDFDPGSGTQFHTPNGSDDVFLCKLDSAGNFGWAHSWGAGNFDLGSRVVVDVNGNVYVTGYYYGKIDFDPGSGVDNHKTNGYIDVFLSKFDSSGNYVRALTWGGIQTEYGDGIAVDGSGNVFATGRFGGTVDFDPGSGVDNRTSVGTHDIFLSKFNSSGDFNWVCTLSGPSFAYDGHGYNIAADRAGNVYGTGRFRGTVDLDPGAGIDNHTSNGDFDIFITRLDSSGDFIWARTWGGSDLDESFDIVVDEFSVAYVTGVFNGTADFDPGSGVDNHTSNGDSDIFLSRFNPDGSW